MQAIELRQLAADNLREVRRLSVKTEVLRFVIPGLVEGDDASHSR